MSCPRSLKRLAAGVVIAVLGCINLGIAAAADIDLADQPLFSAAFVPGNLALALSVEWPTATTPAYPDTPEYSSKGTYLGYFDPDKCYAYKYDDKKPESSYFEPGGAASSHVCSSPAGSAQWSGNYLNWSSMQTLDAFRWVLTGGYRSTDTVDTTILTKTYAASNSASVIPDKTATSGISGATPFDWSTARTRIRNLGTRMYITGSGDFTDVQPYKSQNAHGGKKSENYADPSKTYELYINVKVCDLKAGVEQNCVQYGKNYKPEGLMQQYASKLRFSAFGYYNDSQQLRDGGVMRSRMKFIGPSRSVPGSVSVANDAAEWDASTGVMLANPDKADALATVKLAADAGWTVSIANSGVMNYLNKFGYEAKSYKFFDPVSELYYTTLRYFKNQSNVPEYTDLSGAGNAQTAAQWLDGFPAISRWDDPIQYSCQKNFVLGIGDTFSHRDANLPGSTLVSNREPKPMPSAVAGDRSADVKKSTDMVGKLEGLKGGNTLGDLYGDSSSTTCGTDANMCNTYYIAGLAYDAHTHDIRSDKSGVQTVNTYWMDVIEKQYQHKNQYWLATKYGGFKVPDRFQPYADSNGPETLEDKTWYTSSDTIAINKSAQRSTLKYSTDIDGMDKRPDNYFAANQPERMREGLSKAFAKMSSELTESTSTAFVTASPNQSQSGASYAASYDPQTWTGDVTGYSVAFGSDGTPSLTKVWSAASKLAAANPATRKIVTCCTSSGAALPFTASTMASASLDSRTHYVSFANVPGVAREAQSAADFLDYLRGDRTHEASKSGGVYRTRTHVLGDISGSKVLAVAGPSAAYADASNPGYSGFKRTYRARKTVVYVGANDGMLHAFDGSVSATTGGTELFAYVPSFTYGNARTAATSGLASLGSPEYTHHYFVDASPLVYDIDFNRTGSNSGSGDWHSVLIGGLSKGGKGYFAIDVTNPAAWTTDDAVAEKVLWEFTDERMGYSYGDARVFKTKKYGWVVALASGYNNSDGKGYVFFVNPKTGRLLEAVATPEGSPGAPINMAYLTEFIPDEADYTADSLYVGDLQGNVWRIDLTTTSGSYGTPVKLAKLTDPSGNSQPVTTAVRIAIEPDSQKRYVFVGTGRLLGNSDIASSQVQTFYAIVDGTKSAFYTNASLPRGADFPITRSELNANTSLEQGIGSAPAAAMGWYYDLGRSAATGVAERVTVHPVYLNGVIAAAVNLPSGEPCEPSGTNRVIATKMTTGRSVLLDGNGNLIAASTAVTGTVTDIMFKNIDGRLRLIVGGTGGSTDRQDSGGTGGTSGSGSDRRDGRVASPSIDLKGTTGVKRLNWREVLTSD